MSEADARPRLCALPPALLTQTMLHGQARPVTLKQLASRLRAYLDQTAVQQSLDWLAQEGLALGSRSWTLSETGLQQSLSRFGRPATRVRLESVIWPALVLGYDPGQALVAPLASANTLRAVTLAALYGLPVQLNRVTLNGVISNLLGQGLSDSPPRCVTVGSGLGLEPRSLASVSDLRRQLVRVGLELATREAMPAAGSPVEPEPVDAPISLETFAARVLATIAELPVGPLRDSVPVSDVYDGYRERHDGAGDLSMFKQRLLEAQRGRLLALRQLDRPQALSDACRQRSEIAGKRRPLHLVLRPRRS